MINANELRIGNYVNLSGLVQKITASMICEQDIYDKSNSVLFEPIPLTEQWLLDFGFEAHLSEQTRTRGKLITYTKHYGLSLLIRDGYFNAVVSGAIIKSVFTVHQLQNLYFALTGQELTLKQKK